MKKRGGRARVLAAGALAFILAAPGALGMVDPAAASAEAGPVAVEVTIILASNDGSGVDPGLEGLKGRLSKLKFNSYKLLSVKSMTLQPGGGGSISIPGNRVLQIGGVERAKNRVQMNVSVADIVRTRVSLKKNGTVMLGGIDHGGGELILAISAKF